MAPEQVLGQTVTPQVDVYAFGILLFEVLTELKPITAESVEKIFNQILYQPIDLEPLQPPKYPPAISSLIERCTAKQPAQRPSGLGVVVEEMERILDPTRPVTGRGRSGQHPTVPLAAATATRQPESSHTQSSMISTVTALSTTSPPQRAVNLEGLPGFVRNLPAPLQSQSGLMILACLAVVLIMALVYTGLALAHLI
jgi:serine/threonine protein kinase